MASDPSFVFLLWVALFVGFASSSSFLSDGVFQVHGSTGRSLLQAKKSCPVNFEFLNYTIITSQCKGPQYPAKLCCDAFKEFACPYAADLNDESNDCAPIMFSYIDSHGHYPGGLFSSECREGKDGLSCDPSSQTNTTASASGGQIAQSNLLSLISLVSALVAVFFH